MVFFVWCHPHRDQWPRFCSATLETNKNTTWTHWFESPPNFDGIYQGKMRTFVTNQLCSVGELHLPVADKFFQLFAGFGEPPFFSRGRKAFLHWKGPVRPPPSGRCAATHPKLFTMMWRRGFGGVGAPQFLRPYGKKHKPTWSLMAIHL